MDKIISLKDLSKRLYSRSTHRSFGNPNIGTITVFLTFMFILRSAVNLYFVYLYNDGINPLAYSQIIPGWYIYFSAYFIFRGSLLAFHISYALPDNCFLHISHRGRMFRTAFLRHSAVVKPMNIIIISVAAAGFFIFQITCGKTLLNLSIIPIFLFAITSSYFLFRLAEKLKLQKNDIQILEAVLTGLLVSLNPDVISTFRFDGTIYFLVNSVYIPFQSFFVSAAALISLSLFCFISLIILRLFYFINKTAFSGKQKSGPIVGWYIHFFKINFWIILYLFIIPVVFAESFAFGLKTRLLSAYVLFSALSFIFFLLSCENTVRNSFRNRLLTKQHIYLSLPAIVLHFSLTLIPVLLFVFNNLL